MKEGYIAPPEADPSNRWYFNCEPLFKWSSVGVGDTRWLRNYDNGVVASFEVCAQIACGYESDYLRNIVLKIGKFATADEECAQTLLNVEYRIHRHVYDGEKVISFGIFGEPGCGKSFLAKQLAESTNNEDKPFEIMTFNLSQFSGKDDLLTEAFRTVREKHMQGKIPFVLFDEFDTAKNGETCGWLTSFLMPMQDGKFFDGNDSNELGKCIFFFMGGVFESVEEFRKWMDDKKTEQEAKKLKAPDFHSRLESVIKIPVTSSTFDPGNPMNITSFGALKRAILLRSYFKQKRTLKKIAEDVLVYLLQVPLKHGARSLEKIISASILDTTEVFLASHLSLDALQQHVILTGTNFQHPRDWRGARPNSTIDGAYRLMWRAYHPTQDLIQVNNNIMSDPHNAPSLADRIFGHWQTILNKEGWTHSASLDFVSRNDPYLNMNFLDLPEPETDAYLDAAYEAIFDHIDSMSGRK